MFQILGQGHMILGQGLTEGQGLILQIEKVGKTDLQKKESK